MSERPDAQPQPSRSAPKAPPDLFREAAVSGPECASVQDLAGGYVLAALEPAERRRVDRHRAHCLACDHLLTELQLPVALLGLDVPQVAPPVRAKRDLFAEIAKTPQSDAPFLQPQLTARDSSDLLSPVPTITIPSSRDAFAPAADWRSRGAPPREQVSNRRFRPNWQAIATPLATVPLVLALGIVGVWAMNTQNRLSARSAEVRTLNAQVSTLSNRVNTLNDTLDDVDQFIEAPDAKRYEMTSSSKANSRAAGQVIANPSSAEALVVVTGLGDRHSMYEIVMESEGGELVSAGSLPVTENGDGKAVLKLTQPFSTYRAVHVKPLTDDGSGTADSGDIGVPDTLSGAIDANLGSDGDTDMPDAGQSG